MIINLFRGNSWNELGESEASSGSILMVSEAPKHQLKVFFGVDIAYLWHHHYGRVAWWSSEVLQYLKMCFGGNNWVKQGSRSHFGSRDPIENVFSRKSDSTIANVCLSVCLSRLLSWLLSHFGLFGLTLPIYNNINFVGSFGGHLNPCSTLWTSFLGR